MLRANTKVALSVSSLVAIAAVAVLVVVVLTLRAKSGELEAQVAVIAASAAYVEEYTKLTELLTESEPSRTKLATYILKEDDIISFLSELEQAGRALGLTIETKELKVTPPEEGAPFSTLEVALNFEGGTADAHEFLKLTEQLPYGSSVARFSFVQTGGSGGVGATVTGSLTLNLHVQTYEKSP